MDKQNIRNCQQLKPIAVLTGLCIFIWVSFGIGYERDDYGAPSNNYDTGYQGNVYTLPHDTLNVQPWNLTLLYDGSKFAGASLTTYNHGSSNTIGTIFKIEAQYIGPNGEVYFLTVVPGTTFGILVKADGERRTTVDLTERFIESLYTATSR
jgi:hypothetical protein